MATAHLDTVVRQLRRAVTRQDEAVRTDGQLLSSFIERKDEAAFETLVRRHGRLVYGVCRRVVGSHHDAEDAFQATFLVLARKASSVRPREKVVSWLYGVAFRTAMKAKTMTAKRRRREKHVTEMPEPEAAQLDTWRDLQPLLDQELNGLPENYRLPILLCDLQGKTIKESTQQLGWPQGTLAGRLSRGRRMLAKRLANRGVVLSAGSLAAVVSQHSVSAAVPTSVISPTIKAAAIIAAGQATLVGMVPTKVAILTEGVLKAMLLTKLKTATAVVMLAVAGAGGGVFIFPNSVAARGEAEASSVLPTQGKPKDSVLLNAPNVLEGTWIVVRHEEEGTDQTERFKNVDYRMVIEDGKFIEKNRNQIQLESTFVIDTTKVPKTLDLLVAGEAGRRNLGIYDLLSNHLLVICQSSTGEPRPAEFKTTPKSKRFLTIYQRESPSFKQKAEKAPEPATDREAHPPKAASQREYAIVSKLMEAGADQPKEVLRLPKATIDEGQLIALNVTHGPRNLLEKVVLDEKLRIGTFLDVRVNRIGDNKVRLLCSFQKNDLEKSAVSEIRVLGNSVQSIQDVKLREPLKIVFQRDATGSAQCWVEITVDEHCIPTETPPPPARANGVREQCRSEANIDE